jgi:hypothetical protein
MMLLCASVSYGEEPQDVVVLAGPRMVRHRLGEAENDMALELDSRFLLGLGRRMHPLSNQSQSILPVRRLRLTRENYRLVPETDSRAGSPGDPGVGRL